MSEKDCIADLVLAGCQLLHARGPAIGTARARFRDAVAQALPFLDLPAIRSAALHMDLWPKDAEKAGRPA